jgi:dienelactone hydrolase
VRTLLAVVTGSVVCAASVVAQTQSPTIFNKQRVTFKSGDLTLVGYLFKPNGAGPFPTVVWNHGSEHNPGGGPQFDSVAAVFVPAGYAVFAPMRRGHSDSEGEYVVDATQREAAANGFAAGQKLATRLLESSQLDDQLSGLAFVKKQPFVDTTRLVVAGCSYGGIQTLLGAERAAGYRAAVSISPAALSWRGNPDLRERLERAVTRISVPVFLIQPPKDASLEPARVLGPILEKRSPANRVKIYPAERSGGPAGALLRRREGDARVGG